MRRGSSLCIVQTTDAAGPYELNTGRYVHQSVHYQIQIDVEWSESCRKTKKFICTPTCTPIHRSGRAQLPEPVAFSVLPGDGGLVGHIEIRMQLDDLFAFKRTDAIESPSPRKRTRRRVGACDATLSDA